MTNIFKWIPLIMNAMQVAEKVKNASGKDKLGIVNDSLPSILESIEQGAGNVINEPAVFEAKNQLIAAIKNFENTVRAAKEIKNK